MIELGHLLRERREAAGLTIDQISARTKIHRRHIEAIENAELEKLPGPVYTRAFLRHYAQVVGLDPEYVIEQYHSASAGLSSEEELGEGGARLEASRQGAGGRVVQWVLALVFLGVIGLVVALATRLPGVSIDREQPVSSTFESEVPSTSGVASGVDAVTPGVSVSESRLSPGDTRSPEPAVSGEEALSAVDPRSSEGAAGSAALSTGAGPVAPVVAPVAAPAGTPAETSDAALGLGGELGMERDASVSGDFGVTGDVVGTGGAVVTGDPVATGDAGLTRVAAGSGRADAADGAAAPAVTVASAPRYETGGLLLEVDVRRECWFEVFADGAPIFSGLVADGTILHWEADRELSVRFGRPEGVYLTLNGEYLGVAGTGVITRHFILP